MDLIQDEQGLRNKRITPQSKTGEYKLNPLNIVISFNFNQTLKKTI